MISDMKQHFSFIHLLSIAISFQPEQGIWWFAGWQAKCTQGFLGVVPTGYYFSAAQIQIYTLSSKCILNHQLTNKKYDLKALE